MRRPARDRRGTALVAWSVGPAFLLLAGWFVLASPAPQVPPSQTPAFDAAVLRPLTRPAVLHDPPRIPVGGYEMRCNDCHGLFATPGERRRSLYQHEHIAFEHGLNDRCFNCHDGVNRERLVLRDGTRIGFADSPMLCAQCHGTTYRDWQRGMHGKSLGSWRTSSEQRVALSCVHCHDPHAPAFDPVEPLPGPHTLRLGPRADGHAHAPSKNPLLRRLLHGDADGDARAHPDDAREPEHEQDGEGGDGRGEGSHGP